MDSADIACSPSTFFPLCNPPASVLLMVMAVMTEETRRRQAAGMNWRDEKFREKEKEKGLKKKRGGMQEILRLLY